ncbi:MAG: peptide ABC transporter substrate-binding protein [Alphaproteobacteria bacterium]|nr:peptide ABC transporter substrate-binding protein [Alphaproteobacteria bacterium]
MTPFKKIGLVLLALLNISNTLNADLKILNRGNCVEPATLDVNKACDVSTCAIMRDTYETLVIMGPDGGPIPAAAKSWDVSPDGKTYVFHLHQNAKWSNGEPLTAQDFVYSFQRLADPETASPYGNHLYAIQNAHEIVTGKLKKDALGVKALDAHRFEVTLNAPTPHFLALMVHTCFSPLHQKSLEADKANFTKPGNLVSNGAFKLEKWIPNSIVTLVKNEHYWDHEKVKLDQENFYPLTGETELNTYRAGQLDMTDKVPDEKMTFVRNDPVLSKELSIVPYFSIAYLGYNLTKPPFKDNIKLRQALSLAVDREILTKNILNAEEKPNYSYVYPHTRNNKPYYLDFKSMPKEERIKEARRLYAEAGYSKEKPLEVEISYNTDDNRKKIVTAIAKMLEETLGVKVKMTNTEWKVYLDNRKKKETQIYFARLVGLYNDPHTFAECMLSDSGMNDTGFNCPEYDALVQKAAHEPDMEKRMDLHHAAEKTLVDTHAMMPLYNFTLPQLIKPYVKGYKPNLMGLIYGKDIWIEK